MNLMTSIGKEFGATRARSPFNRPKTFFWLAGWLTIILGGVVVVVTLIRGLFNI